MMNQQQEFIEKVRKFRDHDAEQLAKFKAGTMRMFAVDGSDVSSEEITALEKSIANFDAIAAL